MDMRNRFSALVLALVPLAVGCSAVLGAAPAEVRADEDEDKSATEPSPLTLDAGDSAVSTVPEASAVADTGPVNPCAKWGANTKFCNGKCVYTDDPAFGCGTETCMPCLVAHATAVCRAGECAIAQCMKDYGDCNGKASDGCEYEFPNDNEVCPK